MYNYSIMKLDTDHIEEYCLDIKKQYETGVSNMALFMVLLVPEGDPVIPKAEIQMENYILYRDRLREMGLECGILVQCSIGHGYKLSKKAPFQAYTNLSDGEETYITCPFDEGFMKYIEHSFAVIAAVEPAAIMVDDDFRMIGARAAKGCACPLHMKAFEEAYGKALTREEIYDAVRGKGEENKKIRDAYVKTQIDALIASAKAMRRGIDSVDPKLSGSYCTCGNSAEGAAEIARILAGEGNPVIVRLSNGRYTAPGARYLTTSFQRAAIQMSVISAQGHVDHFLDESDTCPHNRYSTAASAVHAHYTGTILEGATGAKHWITKTNEYQPKAGAAYRRKLSENAKFYEALSKEVPKLRWLGCRAPISTVPDYEFVESSAINNWVRCSLERLGLPIYYSAKDGGAVFMDGDMPNLFSVDEILAMLKGTLVLDGGAAKVLFDRGFSEYMGVDIREWKGAAALIELIGEEKKRVGVPPMSMELVPHAGAEAESMICDIPDGKTDVPLYPGSVYFENSLGGKVITFSGSVNTPLQYQYFSFLDESRKYQLIKLLEKCGHMPVYYPDDAEVYLKAAEHDDGSLVVAFFNIGLDELDSITLFVNREVKNVKFLNKNGEREAVPFTKKGNIIDIERRVGVLDNAILYLN